MSRTKLAHPALMASPDRPGTAPPGRKARAFGGPRPLGLFFLAFCTLGIPALVISSGYAGEAHANGAKAGGAPLWNDASEKIVKGEYDPRLSLAPMLEQVLPAVVSIEARDSRSSSRRQMGATPAGLGSGFIIRADGLIVTNAHVVSHHDSFRVHLKDGQVFEADVIGSDPQTDVALLSLRGAKDLPIARLGQSEGLAVGDWVIAVGNPLGLEQSVTRGIVSAKGRGSLGLYADGYADFVQTDAAISPGNSGGPLFNLKGEVVGMNTAVSGIGQGLGFALPIDQVKSVLEPLRSKGKVNRGWLGITGRDQALRPGQQPRHGAPIAEVHPSTPAAKAGLRGGDLVTSVDGRTVDDFDDLRGRIGEHPPGDKVRLKVLRDGKVVKVDAVLSQRPSPTDLSRYSHATPRVQPKAQPRGRTIPRAPTQRKPPAILGVEIETTEAGVRVRRVQAGSLAARLGLRPGDILEQLNGHAISKAKDVARALSASPDKTSVEVRRGPGTHRAAIQR